ncbi:MAG: hypothetical protein MHMPM18_003987 [Marteilia pararefringens]
MKVSVKQIDNLVNSRPHQLLKLMCEFRDKANELLEKIAAQQDEAEEKKRKASLTAAMASSSECCGSKREDEHREVHYCRKCGHMVPKCSLDEAQEKNKQLSAIIASLEARVCRMVAERHAEVPESEMTLET